MSDRQTSDESARMNTPSDYRVIEEPIFWRRGRSVELTPTPPPDKPEPVRRPAKVARQLALAHHLQAAIERGLVADQAALARNVWRGADPPPGAVDQLARIARAQLAHLFAQPMERLAGGTVTFLRAQEAAR